MNHEVLATLQAARLEFRALLDRPARLVDPADEPAAAEPAADEPAPAAEAPGWNDWNALPAYVQAAQDKAAQLLPASWTAASAAVQLPAGQPSRRKRSTVARRQPLAPLAPLTAQDGF